MRGLVRRGLVRRGMLRRGMRAALRVCRLRLLERRLKRPRKSRVFVCHRHALSVRIAVGATGCGVGGAVRGETLLDIVHTALHILPDAVRC